jgi:hypothetical protein
MPACRSQCGRAASTSPVRRRGLVRQMSSGGRSATPSWSRLSASRSRSVLRRLKVTRSSGGTIRLSGCVAKLIGYASTSDRSAAEALSPTTSGSSPQQPPARRCRSGSRPARSGSQDVSRGGATWPGGRPLGESRRSADGAGWTASPGQRRQRDAGGRDRGGSSVSGVRRHWR